MTTEERREYMRNYYISHREKCDENAIKWRKEHRGRICEFCKKSREKRKLKQPEKSEKQNEKFRIENKNRIHKYFDKIKRNE